MTGPRGTPENVDISVSGTGRCSRISFSCGLAAQSEHKRDQRGKPLCLMLTKCVIKTRDHSPTRPERAPTCNRCANQRLRLEESSAEHAPEEKSEGRGGLRAISIKSLARVSKGPLGPHPQAQSQVAALRTYPAARSARVLSSGALRACSAAVLLHIPQLQQVSAVSSPPVICASVRRSRA